MRVFFCILTLLFLFSCKKDEEQLPPVEKTVTLLGRWTEFLPKTALWDSNGNVIDSIDVNSTYEFKNDYTYSLCRNYITEVEYGSWALDSSLFQKVTFNPVIYPNNGQADHWWRITRLTTDSMKVEHTYKVTLPTHSYGVLQFRKFVKIY